MELIISAFLLGLYGSGHCISMCGPVVGIIGINTTKHRTASAFLSNFGRISTYTVLGLIAALLSIAMKDLKPVQLFFRYFAGILMLFIALQFFGLPRFLGVIEKPFKKLSKPVTKFAQKFFPINTRLRAYLVGMVWGLFPCGLVYAAFAISLNATSFIHAPLIMLSFGVGTLATMISLSLFGNFAGQWLTHPKFKVAAGILILGMTLLYMIPMMMNDLGLSQGGMDHSQHGMMMGHGQMQHDVSPTEDMNHKHMDHSQMQHDVSPTEDMNHRHMDHSQMEHHPVQKTSDSGTMDHN